MNIEQSHLITLSELVKKIYQESSTHSAEDFKEVYLYQTKVLDLKITKEMFIGEDAIFKEIRITSKNTKIITLEVGRYYLIYNTHRKDFCLSFGLQFLGFVENVSDLAEATKDNPLKLEPIYIEE